MNLRINFQTRFKRMQISWENFRIIKSMELSCLSWTNQRLRTGDEEDTITTHQILKNSLHNHIAHR